MDPTILVFTDGEPDDWMALYLLHGMTRAYQNLKLAVVVCYRSKRVMEKIADDICRLMPGTTVRVFLEDPARDGGYPTGGVLDEIPPYRSSEILGIVVSVVCLSLTEVLENFTCQLAPPPLFFYGGQYNLRTPRAKAAICAWKKHAPVFQFDGREAFGSQTNFAGDGPLMQEFAKIASGPGSTEGALAAHVLRVRDAWNAYLPAEFEAEAAASPGSADALNKTRIAALIRKDPAQAVAADPLVILMMLRVCEKTELITNSWRPVVFMDPSFAARTQLIMERLRNQFQEDCEERLVRMLRGEFPEMIPMLPMLKHI